MIERFLSALEAMRAGGAGQPGLPEMDSRRSDWADAVRLQIDCMQQELAPGQRLALHRLLDALEADPPSSAGAIIAEARRVSRVLGLSV